MLWIHALLLHFHPWLQEERIPKKERLQKENKQTHTNFCQKSCHLYFLLTYVVHECLRLQDYTYSFSAKGVLGLPHIYAFPWSFSEPSPLPSYPPGRPGSGTCYSLRTGASCLQEEGNSIPFRSSRLFLLRPLIVCRDRCSPTRQPCKLSSLPLVVSKTKNLL